MSAGSSSHEAKSLLAFCLPESKEAMLSKELEFSLNQAFKQARENHHEYEEAECYKEFPFHRNHQLRARTRGNYSLILVALFIARQVWLLRDLLSLS